MKNILKLYSLLLVIAFTAKFDAVFAQKYSDRIFLASKGKWEYPVLKCTVEPKNTCFSDNKGISFNSDSSYPVKAVFEGEVVLVNEYDSLFMTVIKYGNYFVGYSNLAKSFVQKGDRIKAGQPVGNMGTTIDDSYNVDMQLSSQKNDDIEIRPWFQNRINNPSP